MDTVTVFVMECIYVPLCIGVQAVHVRIYGAFFTTTRYTLVSEMDLQDVMRSGRFFMSTFNDELDRARGIHSVVFM